MAVTTNNVRITKYINGFKVTVPTSGEYFVNISQGDKIYVEEVHDMQLLCIQHEGVIARYLVAYGISDYLEKTLTSYCGVRPYSGQPYIQAEEVDYIVEANSIPPLTIDDLTLEEFQDICNRVSHNVEPKSVMIISYTAATETISISLDMSEEIVVPVKEIMLCRELKTGNKHFIVLKHNKVKYQITTAVETSAFALIGLVYCNGLCIESAATIDENPTFDNTLINFYMN